MLPGPRGGELPSVSRCIMPAIYMRAAGGADELRPGFPARGPAAQSANCIALPVTGQVRVLIKSESGPRSPLNNASAAGAIEILGPPPRC